MHTVDLGIALLWIASCLVTCVCDPEAVPLFGEGSLDAKLYRAHKDYVSWCKRHGIENIMPLFTPKSVGLRGANYPIMSSSCKAAEARACCGWVHELVLRSYRAQPMALSCLRACGSHGLQAYYDAMRSGGLFWERQRWHACKRALQ
eukprot:7501501-Alexandrium_andersonii.AAC.1